MPTRLVAGLTNRVATAGVSVKVAGSSAMGGRITNPLKAKDQGIGYARELYVSFVGPASTTGNYTTFVLAPGATALFPSQPANGIWVNSKFPGHKFVVIVETSLSELDPFVDSDFPPPGPTGLAKTIPSYLYQEYTDDDDLQAFVAAQNTMQQNYVDTFNNLQLPNFTRSPIEGALLDWVGAGVYGMPRPQFLVGPGDVSIKGPYNTLRYNNFKGVYNAYFHLPYPPYLVTTDDIYRRVLAWHFMKRDGKYFAVEWLKRRVYQFLYGVDGIPINPVTHYQISVTFGVANQATIRIIQNIRKIKYGAIYNDKRFQYNKLPYNYINTTNQVLPTVPTVDIFKAAVDSGVLELPFQIKWVVVTS